MRPTDQKLGSVTQRKVIEIRMQAANAAATANARQTEMQLQTLQHMIGRDRPAPFLPKHVPESTKKRVANMSESERRTWEMGTEKRLRPESSMPRDTKKRASDLHQFSKKPVCWTALNKGVRCTSGECTRAPCGGFGHGADPDRFYQESRIKK